MTWIDDNKGSGPWDFTEQPNKLAYNEGDEIATIEDPVWNTEYTGIPITNVHKPCGYWHKGPTGQYTEYIKIVTTEVQTGEWVAAMTQRSTDFIYVYDLSYESIMKINVQNPPTLEGILEIDNLYSLDYGKGFYGADKGAHCINKSETRLWYLFRSGNNCQLVEVDISGSTMVLVKKTSFSSLLSGDVLMDACATDDYVYFCTNLLTGRIIKFGTDHTLIDNHLFTLNLYGGSGLDQGITQMDVLQSTGDLFWNYVTNKAGYNACGIYIRSNASFVTEVAVEHCGIGFLTPWNQNLLEIHEGYVLQQRTYYPATGRLYSWVTTSTGNPNYDYSERDDTDQDWMQSILGVVNNKLFTLWFYNADTNIRLGCIDFPALGSRTGKIVGQYLKSWSNPVTAAVNNEIVVLFRWDGSKNILTCFEADSGLAYLCQVNMEQLTTYVTIKTVI